MLVFAACKNTSHLAVNEYLLNKNSLKTDNSKVSSDDMSSYIKQKPNRKILGVFRFHLWVYNMVNKKKTEDKKIAWLNKTDKKNEARKLKGKKIISTDKLIFREKLLNIGEAPVVLDTFLTDKSVKQIKMYLNNKGFFNAKVSRAITYNKKKKKANVVYNVTTGNPYIVRNIKYSTHDAEVKKIILDDTANALIRKGKNYDVDEMQAERDRITKQLKNNGYYYFAKEYIDFRIDSTLKSNQLDIRVRIGMIKTKKKINDKDTTITENHQQYKINKIFIFPEYRTLQLDTFKYDTTEVKIPPRKKGGDPSIYYFIANKNVRNKVRYKTITQSVFIEPGKYFNLTDVEKTYNRLAELRFYKFTNITFTDISDQTTDKSHQLDCHIELTRTPTQSLNYEVDGTNSSGNLGVAGNIIYQNKNFFRGTEIFNVKLKGALEVQKVTGQSSSDNTINNVLPFNTMETGIETGLDIPKFFVPIRAERFPKYFRPKTTIQAGLNFQQRPDYTRYVANMTFGYDWKENAFKRHILNPIEINSVKIKLDPAFEQTISGLSQTLQSAYRDHLTAALKYSFIFSNQQTNKTKKFVYFRGTFESAGNLLRLINSTIGSPKSEDGYYSIFNIRYAQYLRADVDFRHYNKINPHTTFIYRTILGVGLPYGNFPAMPFEKSFYVGGANDIRAWQIRTLGPGSFVDSLHSVLDKTGDIMLEGNIENRFGIYKFLQGAVFVDAGNVWLMNKNAKFQDGEFLWDKFYKQIAIGAGLGLRFDFSFFVFRIDAAVPLKDPTQPEDHRWVINDFRWDGINFNLGIGYPF